MWSNQFHPRIMQVRGAPFRESPGDSGAILVTVYPLHQQQNEAFLHIRQLMAIWTPISFGHVPLSTYFFACSGRAGLHLFSQQTSLHRAMPLVHASLGLPGIVGQEHHACSSSPVSSISIYAGLGNQCMETCSLLLGLGKQLITQFSCWTKTCLEKELNKDNIVLSSWHSKKIRGNLSNCKKKEAEG